MRYFREGGRGKKRGRGRKEERRRPVRVVSCGKRWAKIRTGRGSGGGGRRWNRVLIRELIVCSLKGGKAESLDGFIF